MIGVARQDEGAAAEAAAWLARLQRDGLDETDGLAFDAWLAAGPGHRAAYEQALAAWRAFDVGADQILDELAAQARAAPQRALRSRRWLVGAGGLLAAATVALAVLPAQMSEPQVQTFATGKGEHRHVALADGSTVDLNAETRLQVQLGPHERRLALGEGEAIFDVAHDEARPFTVAASGHVVRVVGTQFDVRNRHGELTVTVARGKVQVRPIASGQAFLLTPGQQLQAGPAGLEQITQVDPQEAFGWRLGRLVYRDEPLANVVADLNRQFPQQIEIADPALGKTPITGVIVLDDQASVMTRLSLMLPIRSVPSERGLLLLRK